MLQQVTDDAIDVLVDLSGLQNGNYLLQVHADEFVRTKAVQVAR